VRIRLHANVLADLSLSVVAEKTLFEAEEAGSVPDDPEQASPAEESFAE
jgi:hypothetical protein